MFYECTSGSTMSYPVSSDGGLIEGAGEYVDRCQAMLTTLHEFCPQLDTDGLHNIWIIKPGAKSRGRGEFHSGSLRSVCAVIIPKDGDLASLFHLY